MLSPRRFVFTAGRTIFLISISVSIAAIDVVAQAKASSDEHSTVRTDLGFDVVSIRPSNAGPDQWHFRILPGGDRYEAIGMPLGMTIMMAYFPILPVSKDRISGVPGWVWNDKYDVIGKVDETELPAWRNFSQRGLRVRNPMLQTMLQNALADRCKMTIHRTPAQIGGYALVVANHGINRKNLVESKPSDAIPESAIKIDLDARVIPFLRSEDPVAHFYQTSMTALALFLTGSAVIEDRTGLSGKFKFDLTRLGNEGIPSSDWDLAPLGLKLVPTKVPTEIIVIDHIERPSPN
jgi:uncharacterized protein (TIGR03435 family)